MHFALDLITSLFVLAIGFVVLSIIVLFFMAQRMFIEGISMSGLKG